MKIHIHQPHFHAHHLFLSMILGAAMATAIILWMASAVAQCVPGDLGCMNLP